VRGCGFGALSASAKEVGTAIASKEPPKAKPEPEPKWRDLGKLATPSQELLIRLRVDEAKRNLEAKQRELAEKEHTQFVGWSTSSGELQPIGLDTTTGQLKPMSFAAVPGIAAIGSRKGPFCRVTCSFHHGEAGRAGKGDVEVDADYCKTQRIDPKEMEVMGWIPIDAKYEQKNPWPGPAQGGLDSFKLYWK
jgi:hypothetical protein